MSAILPVADLEALLKPISDESPAGQDLRSILLDAKKGIYWHDRIREAHRENLYETVPKLPDWPTVISLSTQALSTLTKDLQVAAWLSDGLVKHNGHDRLAGLRDSFRLVRGLIEQYWETVFPAIDPEGEDGQYTARGNIIAGLDTRLALAVKAIPLTESTTGLKYSFANWEESKVFDVPDKEKYETLTSDEAERADRLREQAVQGGKVTGEEWRRAVSGTPYQFFRERLELLNECSEELTALDEAMDLRFQRETPGVKGLQKSLDEMTSLVRNLEQEKRPPELAPPQGGLDSPDGQGALPMFSGSVQTRQEALRRLAEVADYFRQAEPHSPISYLVQRAVKWGNMPLESWLEEVVKDRSVLDQVRETLGIKSE
jgi:type VI secretion system protein ImpA